MFHDMRFFNSQSKTITSAAIVIGIATLASKILGLLRNMALASKFGAGYESDIYYASFRVPDLVFNILVIGALSAGFIPIFTDYYLKNEKQAWKFANDVFNIILLSVGVVCVGLIIFAPKIMPLVVPGFSGEKLEDAIGISRIMFLQPIFLAAGSVFGGILQSFKRFLVFSSASIVYNLGIIIGILVFASFWGVYGLVFGVILGAFFHFLIQALAARGCGFKYNWVFDFSFPGIKKIWKLMLPRVFNLSITQINFFIITIIASKLQEGSLAIFNFANDFQAFPVTIFAASFAVAAFPAMSQFASLGENHKLVRVFSKTFSKTLFLLMPASLLMWLLRFQIVKMFLGYGLFGSADINLTSQTLAFFALGIVAFGLIPLAMRAFFSFQDTKTPFITGVASAIANIFLSLWLSRTFGVAGLALAFSFTNILNIILLLIFLRLKLKEILGFDIFISFLKFSLAAFISALVVYGIIAAFEPVTGFQTLFQGLAAGATGIAVYVIFSLLLGVKEARGLPLIKKILPKR